ncbi:phage recombination protein Bet [Nocardia sp. CDC159]|uniref:Phage recombination protein Bet n=1 Tax=Nocardia pulmonis TaxID=2951408 RepID=A0A9X2E608_9NOCA|nr:MULTISPECIES: phage recombination protein Bet [Nocardia]MCM6774942.1 phage recombination protein Bet [Nocardia pulmonis]MCM6789873.1 phage recombination protein Bet [Nocardia sp. CDC159]
MTSTDLAVPAAATTELTLRPDQDSFTDVQLAALRQLGVENAPEGDIKLFFHLCQRTGLDPYAKQIYMIGRKTKSTTWHNGEQVDRWVTRYTIQTGIDGYRVTGARIAETRGDDLEFRDPLWCGRDGRWTDVWLDPDNSPAAAKYVIVKNGKQFPATAMYAEYVQMGPSGKQPNAMWSKMPAHMLAKCAEAAAWRRAYPHDFSGLVLEDAAHTVIDADIESPARRPAPRHGVAGLRAAVGLTAPPANEHPEAGAELPLDNPPPADSAQHKTLSSLLDEAGYKTPARKRAYLSELIGRPIKSARELTAAEATQLIDTLAGAAHAAAAPAVAENPKATPAQVKALENALIGEAVHDEAQRLDWVRNAVHNPDLASMAELTGEQAEAMTRFLLDAQAADAHPATADSSGTS